MPDQRDVQQLIQSLTPSAVNNGNPNTVYNQPMPQGVYIPPTFDPGTNTWRVNPAPTPSTVNWQQMSASQPQSWGWQGPAQPAPPTTGTPPPVVAPPVTTTPIPITPVPPVVNQPMTPEETAGFPGDGSWDLANHSGRDDPSLRWKQQPMIMQAPVGPNDVGYLFQSPVQYPDRNSGGSSQLGQGIYDAYGGAPSGATNNSGYMDAAWGGVGNSNVDTWDTSWMQSTAAGSNIPTMPPVQATPSGGGGMYDYQNPAPEANDTDSIWKKAVNWLDNNTGNMYDETTNSWNKGNIGWGLLSALTGMPLDDAVQRVSLNNLFGNGGVGADYARTQSQQAYDRSNAAQREAMVTNLAKKYNKTPQEVLQIIGRMP